MDNGQADYDLTNMTLTTVCGSRNVGDWYETTGTGIICIGQASVAGATDSNTIVVGNATTSAANGNVTFGDGTATITNVLDGSTATWTAASDERLKQDIKDYTAGLSFLLDLRPVTYRWRAKKDVPKELAKYYAYEDYSSCRGRKSEGKTFHGFVAQEVKAVLNAHPEVPNGVGLWAVDDDGTQEIGFGELMPMVVNALKEINTRLARLEK